MTHKWKLYDDGSGAFCVAHHEQACMMDRDDVERRLNATEELSGDVAEFGADFSQDATNKHGMSQEIEGNIYFLTEALMAYARVLEDN